MPNMKMRLISICNFRVESKCDRRSRNMNYCAQYFYFYYYYLFPLGFISVAMQHFVVRFWWAKWQDDFFFTIVDVIFCLLYGCGAARARARVAIYCQLLAPASSLLIAATPSCDGMCL